MLGVACHDNNRQEDERDDPDGVRREEGQEGEAEPGDARRDRRHKKNAVPAVEPLARDQPSRDDEPRKDADDTQHHVNQREGREAADHGTSFREEETTRRQAHTLSPAHTPRTRMSLANTRRRSTTSHTCAAKMSANNRPVTSR